MKAQQVRISTLEEELVAIGNAKELSVKECADLTALVQQLNNEKEELAKQARIIFFVFEALNNRSLF